MGVFRWVSLKQEPWDAICLSRVSLQNEDHDSELWLFWEPQYMVGGGLEKEHYLNVVLAEDIWK